MIGAGKCHTGVMAESAAAIRAPGPTVFRLTDGHLLDQGQHPAGVNVTAPAGQLATDPRRDTRLGSDAVSQVDAARSFHFPRCTGATTATSRSKPACCHQRAIPRHAYAGSTATRETTVHAGVPRMFVTSPSFKRPNQNWNERWFSADWRKSIDMQKPRPTVLRVNASPGDSTS